MAFPAKGAGGGRAVGAHAPSLVGITSSCSPPPCQDCTSEAVGPGRFGP